MSARLVRRGLIALGGLGLVIAIIALRFEFPQQVEIDACEDTGGRWDRQAETCDFTVHR